MAATTGVVAATVVAMGLISLPIMLRYGYDKKLATGVIAASGTLGQIIPPSVVLIVLADQLGMQYFGRRFIYWFDSTRFDDGGCFCFIRFNNRIFKARNCSSLYPPKSGILV